MKILIPEFTNYVENKDGLFYGNYGGRKWMAGTYDTKRSIDDFYNCMPIDTMDLIFYFHDLKSHYNNSISKLKKIYPTDHTYINIKSFSKTAMLTHRTLVKDILYIHKTPKIPKKIWSGIAYFISLIFLNYGRNTNNNNLTFNDLNIIIRLFEISEEFSFYLKKYSKNKLCPELNDLNAIYKIITDKIKNTFKEFRDTSKQNIVKQPNLDQYTNVKHTDTEHTDAEHTDAEHTDTEHTDAETIDEYINTNTNIKTSLL
jgi:hypothetical protein